MRNQKIIKSGLAALGSLLVVVWLLTGSFAFAQVDSTRYVAGYLENNAGVDDAITNAGGTVIANYPQINVLVAESDNPGFASAVSANKNFNYVVKDMEVNWLPDVQVDETDLLSLNNPGPSPASSPFGASFFSWQWNINITKTDQAWAVTQGDPAVKVAVLDTGIDSLHPDLVGRVDATASASFVTEPAACAPTVPPACIGCPAWQDRGFHGTHVAGTISTNNIGTAGIAPNVMLRAVKVLDCTGSGTFGAVIMGIMHAADNGNDVIVMSLGAYFPKNGGPGPGSLGQLVASLNKAVNYAQTRGALVVSAAGNEGIDLDKDKNFAAVPCQSGSGMCVGSTTRSDALSSFSNHGLSGPQIVAPGGGNPIAPFPPGINEYILAPCNSRSVLIPICATPGLWYVPLQGTSMATPHVAGAAALVDSIAPAGPGSLRAGQLRNNILKGADDLGKKGADNIYSHGRLNTLGAVTQ